MQSCLFFVDNLPIAIHTLFMCSSPSISANGSPSNHHLLAHNVSEVERILGNARRLGNPAGATAHALELVAPQPEAEWLVACPHCLGERGLAFRLSFDAKRSAGDCPTCAYSGCDVLVALVSI